MPPIKDNSITSDNDKIHKKRNFLAILFGCHCRADRSFFFHGKQFPICARCTGILVGWVLGIILAIFFGTFKWYISVSLMLPLIIDGASQHLTKYESNNLIRLITGIMFGIFMIQGAVYFHLSAVYTSKFILEKLSA